MKDLSCIDLVRSLIGAYDYWRVSRNCVRLRKKGMIYREIAEINGIRMADARDICIHHMGASVARSYSPRAKNSAESLRPIQHTTAEKRKVDADPGPEYIEKLAARLKNKGDSNAANS